MSYEANIHTQASILLSGDNASLKFHAYGFGEDETPRLRFQMQDGDYSFSSTTVHIDEIPVGRIVDTVRSLREVADAIETWNAARAIEEDALDSVATSDGPT